MRKLLTSLLIFSLLVVTATTAFADIPAEDEEMISDQMDLIIESINDSDVDSLIGILSPNASPELEGEILQSIEGKNIRFEQDIKSVTELAENEIRVDGIFAAEGINWNISGFKNYYVFEKDAGEWLLKESDFAKKLNSDFVFDLLKNIFGYALPVFLVFFGFWLWMLIDCINRPIKNKALWLLIIFFGSCLGALIYFFTVRRSHIQESKVK